MESKGLCGRCGLCILFVVFDLIFGKLWDRWYGVCVGFKNLIKFCLLFILIVVVKDKFVFVLSCGL